MSEACLDGVFTEEVETSVCHVEVVSGGDCWVKIVVFFHLFIRVIRA